MKKTINKILALICTMALVVSMCSFVTVFAASQVQIITAQFMPYEGQIKVLASLDEGYTDAKVYVNGQQITVIPDVRDDGNIVFTSAAFNPTAYGIATVKLEAIVGGTTYSDTQNIKIYKVTSKTNALSENFDELECIAMSDATDTSVTDMLADSSQVTALNIPDVDGDKVNNKTIASIANRSVDTTDDNAIYFDIPSVATADLPGLVIAPNQTTNSGTVEISFDVFGDKSKSRASMYIYAPNRKRYVFKSLAYKNASDNGAYYAVCHDESTFARTDVKFITNTWHKVRFLLNIDEYTYQYYINDELIDYGTLSNLDTTACNGFGSFEMQIGCGYANTLIAIDNINVNYFSFVTVADSKENDITSLLSFDNSVGSDVITANSQKYEVIKKCETIALKDAMSFYYINSSSYTGTSSKNAFFAIDDFGKQDCGRIVLEHDLYVTDKSATLNYELTHTKSSAFYPLQDSSLISGGKIGSKSVNYYSGWNTIKIVVDFQLQRTEVYFNNELVESKDGLHATTTIPNYLKVRINYIPSTTPAVDVENFAFAIDNWRVYKELPISEITAVTSYDISGNSAAVVNTSVVTSDTNKFEVALTNTEYCDETSLETNAKVLADGVEVQDAVSLSDGTLTIDVSDVPAHADLELVIGKDTLLYDGTTTIGADTVFNLKTANENGLYIKRTVGTTAESFDAACKLDLISGSKDVAVIFASYDGDELVGITTRTYKLTGAKSLSLNLPKANATKVKLFVCDNLESSVTPYETELEYSIPSQN